MKLLLYSTTVNNRLEYVVNLVFHDLLGIKVELTSNKLELHNIPEVAIIEYGHSKNNPHSLLIPKHPLLFENNIQQQKIEVSHFETLPMFFNIKLDGAAIPFDLFAFVFYLVSRYEEYLTHQKDTHWRFPAHQSLAFQNRFLDQPVVNQWVNHLGQLLQKQFPQLQFTYPSYSFQASYDIDYAWRFKYAGVKRKWGGLIKDILSLKLSTAYQRIQVLTNKQEDPYDTYDYMDNLHEKFHIQAIYFFLICKYSRIDPGHSIREPAFLDLIRRVNKRYTVGIHPSYASNKEKTILAKELKQLSTILDQKIEISRQHYLKLELPQTYQQLLALGIKRDYTMGYAAAGGFRASIAHPFKWYDLQEDKATDLTVVPFQIMDVTLKNYLKLQPEEALNYVQELIQNTKSVGGHFSMIWHNSSLSDIGEWENWRDVYEKILASAI